MPYAGWRTFSTVAIEVNNLPKFLYIFGINKLSLAQFVLKQLMKEMCQFYIIHSVFKYPFIIRIAGVRDILLKCKMKHAILWFLHSELLCKLCMWEVLMAVGDIGNRCRSTLLWCYLVSTHLRKPSQPPELHEYYTHTRALSYTSKCVLSSKCTAIQPSTRVSFSRPYQFYSSLDFDTPDL